MWAKRSRGRYGSYDNDDDESAGNIVTIHRRAPGRAHAFRLRSVVCYTTAAISPVRDYLAGKSRGVLPRRSGRAKGVGFTQERHQWRSSALDAMFVREFPVDSMQC